MLPATLVNFALMAVPRAVTATTQTAATSATMRAYSTMVAPDSSFKKPLVALQKLRIDRSSRKSYSLVVTLEEIGGRRLKASDITSDSGELRRKCGS